MKFNLIICTFKRPQAVNSLLDSLALQTICAEEVLVIDSSPDELTKNLLEEKNFPNLRYYKVDENHRGLTRQRNYGINKTGKDIKIITFLDDDIILEPNYFENLLKTYSLYQDAIGVGGYIVNEVQWKEGDEVQQFDEFKIDGYIRKLGSRNLMRKRLGLLSNVPPGVMPDFSNGLPISFFPPSGKTYPVEFFMGGVASYRKELFEKIYFSKYFTGYGLYEDLDFCLRTSQFGQLYLNTSARVIHNHVKEGRPNKYEYGRMVIKNGWYVWRVKYPDPGLIAKIKWYSTALLLIFIRLTNVFNTNKPKEAFTESIGRLVGLFRVIFKK